MEPRYCPSLETKFARFPGRSHHVWLEPEGLDSDVVYPNGLSCSLEPEDQLRLLQTVPGEARGAEEGEEKGRRELAGCMAAICCTPPPRGGAR